jgi:6-phosphogluconate dehydrogenase
MGANIVRRLHDGGHRCVVFDVNPAASNALVEIGAIKADSLRDLLEKLTEPHRAVWLMLPAGPVTEATVDRLAQQMREGDAIIDGGNSFYKDAIRRSATLAPRGIDFVDCGTSGGVWGLERGYCLMIGGPKALVERLDPIFATLAPGMGAIPRTPSRQTGDPRAELGYLHTGPAGSGHFVKMVHNGIEYGLMQAYAEGFDILAGKASPALPEGERFDLELPDIAEVWRRGSVISSWLLDLTATALARDPHLERFVGAVPDSGEGRWTINAAIEESVPADVLTAALFARFRSRQTHTLADKLLSAMRFGFGGHAEADRIGANGAADGDNG